MSKEVCKAINDIDKLITAKVDGDGIFVEYNNMFDAYCPTNIRMQDRKNDDEGQCSGYSETVISAFIQLQESFKSDNGQEKLEKDKLAQYAILWLSYKINKHPIINYGIDDIYNNFAKYRYWTSKYNKYIEQIKKYMNIKDMSKLYEAFILLCNMYTEIDANKSNCTKCSQKAHEFVKKFKILNDDSNNTEGSSYTQLLHTLSNDYDNLKKKCANCQSINLPTLPSIKPKKISPPNSVESYGKTPIDNSVQVSDVTTSNSSIASKLIPILLIFSIPIFLGIAYKYSLFGFDKRLQRKYLKEKLKKIKKKINLNI
ncbi:Plasmodium variant antigen protein Cir/Yir/Bir, putative [Plasmodium chabaudi chabaudi]|uniref:Plasmodium variant antigen protein Cir/Yir/Bir, putative n=1 Tax=Plasmodium chabaudi chabaudi TaxID=31271 RepID=A0A1D3L7B3_PLACU|nr:Plasmodium variant antigen protein Cir/Yir/Bir, putative [Plasmodium chabaudi chabaudi]